MNKIKILQDLIDRIQNLPKNYYEMELYAFETNANLIIGNIFGINSLYLKSLEEALTSFRLLSFDILNKGDSWDNL